MSDYDVLEQKLEEGYGFVLSKNTSEAAKIWNEAWMIFLELSEANRTKTIEEFDKIFNENEYISNWIMDYERILQETAEKNYEYYKIIGKVSSEYLKRFDDGTSNTINLVYRKAFCESLFALENESKSEEYFIKYLKAEPGWTDGWLCFANCWTKYTEGTKKNLRKAEAVLEMALKKEQLQMDGKTRIIDKLIEIYIKLKDEKKIKEMKKLKKDVWGQNDYL